MPEFENVGYVTDTYMHRQHCIQQLINDYHKYGRIIVAYDFDDTVRPDDGCDCSYVTELLAECSKIDERYMICFTCRTEPYDEVISYLDSNGIRHDKINDNADDIEFETSRKILYSVFLDNRAGLKSAYEILVGFLKWYYQKEG